MATFRAALNWQSIDNDLQGHIWICYNSSYIYRLSYEQPPFQILLSFILQRDLDTHRLL